MFLSCLVFAMSLCASVYMCFVVTCWERADLLALVCSVCCEFVTFPLVSWVRCGTWFYRFLIFAALLTLNLSCAKDFRNLNSIVTLCINWRRLLALIFFQCSSLKYMKFPIIKKVAITLLYCSRLHAWWSTQSRLATLLSSLIARWWVRLQTLWRFQL